MLQDFPPTEAPATRGPDPLLRPLRLAWWLIPFALLALDVFNTAWFLLVRSLGGLVRMSLLMWLPFVLSSGLVLAVVAYLWSRRAWPPGVQAGLLAGAAIPLVRALLGQLFVYIPSMRMGGMSLFIHLLLGPALGLVLAFLALSARRGRTGEDRGAATPAVLALAVVAGLVGGWVTWALLPLVSLVAGDPFTQDVADSAAPVDSPTTQSLRMAGLAGLGSALATVVVPLVGLLRGRGMFGTIYALDALALLVGALTWTFLGMAWAKGRAEGRLLRVFTWIALGLPVLLVLAGVVLLLVFNPRLF